MKRILFVILALIGLLILANSVLAYNENQPIAYEGHTDMGANKYVGVNVTMTSTMVLDKWSMNDYPDNPDPTLCKLLDGGNGLMYSGIVTFNGTYDCVIGSNNTLLIGQSYYLAFGHTAVWEHGYGACGGGGCEATWASPIVGTYLNWISAINNWDGTGTPAVTTIYYKGMANITLSDLVINQPVISWESENPANNSIYNATTSNPITWSYNATHADAGENIRACYLLENGVNAGSVTYNGEGVNSTFTTYGSLALEGINTFQIQCDDGSTNATSTIKNLILDTTPPGIPQLGMAFPLADNTSVTITNVAVPLNISCYDDNSLWSFGFNITTPAGGVGNSFYIDGLTSNIYNYNTPVDMSSYTNGTAKIDITCYDSHTLMGIEPYYKEVDLAQGMLSYYTQEDNVVIVKAENPLTAGINKLSTTKLSDRYTFDYEFNNNLKIGDSTYEFILYSDKKINYLANSKYPAHFIIMGDKGGNWIDFELPDKKAKYVVKQIEDNTYRITITTSQKTLAFQSIGGLNRAEQHIDFRLGNSNPSTPTTITPEDYALNDTTTLSLWCNDSTDSDGDTIYYDYFADNTLATTQVCTNLVIPCDWNNPYPDQIVYWNCQANDTIGTSNKTSTRSINTQTWDIISANMTGPDDVISSETIAATLDLSYNEIRYKSSAATVNIGQESYDVSEIEYNNYTHYTLSLPYNVSLYPNNTITWYWNISLQKHDDTYYYNNTFSDTANTYDLLLYNCSGDNSSLVFNITNFHEETLGLLGSETKGNLYVWKGDYNMARVSIIDYNDTAWDGTNPETMASRYICLNIMTPVNISAYLVYSSPGGFTQRYYINKADVANSTVQSVYLYNRDSQSGINQLKGSVRNEATYALYPDAITKMLRYYPGENVWRIVQMDKSDEYGQVIFNIRETDTDYYFIFQDLDNRVIKTTDTMKFKCDLSTGYCYLTFVVDTTGTSSTNELVTTGTLDEATDIYTTSWNDATGITKTVRTLITKETMTDTVIMCDTTTTAASGSHSCNLSGYTGRFLVQVYSSASPERWIITEWIEILGTDLYRLLGNAETALWSFGISLTFVLFGAIISPVAGIILTLLSLIINFSLGLGSIITIPFIIAACILGVILGMRIRS